VVDSSSKQPSHNLISAGRFGTLTLLSPKALRLYAERGLLQPEWTDPSTGYRWYGAHQVTTGRVIGLLRGADMPLGRIKDVIHSDPAAALAFVEAYADSIDRRRAAHHAVLGRVRRHYRKDDRVTIDDRITSTVDPGRAVLSDMRRPPVEQISDVITSTLDELFSAAEAAGMHSVDDPFGIYHGPVTEDCDGPLEICVVLEDVLPTANAEHRSYRLPGGRLACRRIDGEEAVYPAILTTYDDLAAWVERSGHQRVGPPREIWHDEDDDAGFSMTVCWPYA
jgi:DNA-binding transcriptional MerR regulator